MGIEILPKSAAENLVIGRLAGADGGEERSPGVRHAAADGVEVEANAARFAQQAAGEVIECELAGRGYLSQMTITYDRLKVVGDAQCGHYVYAPRRAKIAKRPEIHAAMMAQRAPP